MNKPPAVISIDVDSLWVVTESMGHFARLDETAIYTTAVPEFLRLLDLFSAKATFFCVGRDLTIDSNREVVAEIARRGHEIANHTMNHPTKWAKLSLRDKLKEITTAHEELGKAGIDSVFGFRASAYYLDQSLVSGLTQMGYVYDSSVFPNPWISFLMPLGRMLMARSIKDTPSYGRIESWQAPLHPYLLHKEQIYRPSSRGRLLELPISCIPGLRLPFHSSFVFGTGLWLFKWGLKAIQRRKLPLVYVFHAVDLLDGDANGRLRNYVTTRIPFTRRLEMVRSMINCITKNFRVVTMRELAFEYKRMPGANFDYE